MARPGAKDACTFLARRGLAAYVLGFYLLIIHGAHGAEQQADTGSRAQISRIELTIHTEDGKSHQYVASPSVAAFLPESPTPRLSWFQSVSRNVAVGITAPLLVLAISELLSWLKQRAKQHESKEKSRKRAKERKRLLRDIYAIQNELDDLEDESPEAMRRSGRSEDPVMSSWRKARIHQLKVALADRRYQLRDMYIDTSNRSEETSKVSGSSRATHDDWSGEETRLSGTMTENLYQETSAPSVDGSAAVARPAQAEQRATYFESSTLESTVSKDPRRRRVVARGGKREAGGTRRRERGHPDRMRKPSRIEVVRQLIDEVPGMPPREVLRAAEKVSTRA